MRNKRERVKHSHISKKWILSRAHTHTTHGPTLDVWPLVNIRRYARSPGSSLKSVYLHRPRSTVDCECVLKVWERKKKRRERSTSISISVIFFLLFRLRARVCLCAFFDVLHRICMTNSVHWWRSIARPYVEHTNIWNVNTRNQSHRNRCNHCRDTSTGTKGTNWMRFFLKWKDYLIFFVNSGYELRAMEYC